MVMPLTSALSFSFRAGMKPEAVLTEDQKKVRSVQKKLAFSHFVSKDKEAHSLMLRGL